jgi:hypothetical protein
LICGGHLADLADLAVRSSLEQKPLKECTLVSDVVSRHVPGASSFREAGKTLFGPTFMRFHYNAWKQPACDQAKMDGL